MHFEIIIGSAMIVVTTIIQGVFTMVGVEYMRDYANRHNEPALIWSTLRLAAFVLWRHDTPLSVDRLLERKRPAKGDAAG